MESRSFFLFLALAFACWSTTAKGDIWSLCGTPKDHLQITSVKIIPDPPVKGQNITVMVSGSLDENVTSGQVHILFTWNNAIVFVNETYSLCDLAKIAGTECPIAQGPHSYTVTHVIPDELLKGTYAAKVQAWEQNNQNITCVDVAFKLT